MYAYVVHNIFVITATGDVAAESSCLTHSCNYTLHEECRVVRGRARCSCPGLCERVIRPVCASDGRTYDSPCHLRRHACITRQPLRVRYLGMCGRFGS